MELLVPVEEGGLVVVVGGGGHVCGNLLHVLELLLGPVAGGAGGTGGFNAEAEGEDLRDIVGAGEDDLEAAVAREFHESGLLQA